MKISKFYHSRDADMSIIETSIFCPQCLFLGHLLSAETWFLTPSSLVSQGLRNVGTKLENRVTRTQVG